MIIRVNTFKIAVKIGLTFCLILSMIDVFGNILHDKFTTEVYLEREWILEETITYSYLQYYVFDKVLINFYKSLFIIIVAYQIGKSPLKKWWIVIVSYAWDRAGGKGPSEEEILTNIS